MGKNFIEDDGDKIAERKRAKRREQWFALVLLSPFIIVFVLFCVVPFIMGFAYSFMRYDPYNAEYTAFNGFKNYANLFNTADINVSKEFWKSFGPMLLFDIVAVPVMMIIPFALAYFINMRPPFYKFFRACIYLPCVVSISIMGIMFGEIFAGDETGLINSWFGTNIDWLGGKPFENDILRWIIILIATIWWQTGTNFVIFSGALRDIPKSLYEACEMDGGGRWQSIIRVTIPNIRPAINITLFNTLIGFLSLYGQPYVLNTVENQNIYVSPMMFIQSYLSNGLAYAKQTGYLCASAIVFGVIIMLLSFIERRVMEERHPTAKHVAAYKRYCDFRTQRLEPLKGESK